MSREQKDTVTVAIDEEAYWSALFLQEEFLRDSPQAVEEPRSRAGDESATIGSEADGHTIWQLVHEAYASERILHLPVTGFNKGGLLVAWLGLQGFVPASQLVDFPLLHVARERLQALASLRGKTLTLRIIEVNPQKDRLILSERATQVRARQKADRLQQVHSGDKLSGRVTNLTDFGAFVDLGGVEGLIHISELSWSRVTHPSHVVQPGQVVEVLVLNIDRNKERIGLSYKRLKADPWQTVEERYKPGDLVSGVVSNVVSFGAFVLLEEELEGLIHISELAEGSFLHPRNVVQQGDPIKARVLQVEGRKKRLALSLRGLQSQ